MSSSISEQCTENAGIFRKLWHIDEFRYGKYSPYSGRRPLPCAGHRNKFNKALKQMQRAGIGVGILGIGVRHGWKWTTIFDRWNGWLVDDDKAKQFILEHINQVYESIGECKREQAEYEEKRCIGEKRDAINTFKNWVRCKVGREG